MGTYTSCQSRVLLSIGLVGVCVLDRSESGVRTTNLNAPARADLRKRHDPSSDLNHHEFALRECECIVVSTSYSLLCHLNSTLTAAKLVREPIVNTIVVVEAASDVN